MINFLNKFFKTSNNLDYIVKRIKGISKDTPVKNIFLCINNFSPESELRYVGGCVRKTIRKEIIDDVDLATNLSPQQVCEALKKYNINYYKTGFEHGTITAVIDNHNFEITSLREDIKTYGRHAEVKFCTDWKKDASRRDFTINAIYSDIEGNLFDPHNGKEDLKRGIVKFIGDPEKRIKEDYLRILRYLRFFLIYSNYKHDSKIITLIKKNIGGISNLSKERLLNELQKFLKFDVLISLAKDKFSSRLFEIIFPQIKNIRFFVNPNNFVKEKIKEGDFIFLLSVLIVDGTDNVEYFLYKYNISKKDQKRLGVIDNFYRNKITSQSFSERELNKILYYHGKQSVLDILNYRIFTSKKAEKKYLDLIEKFRTKVLPKIPIQAITLKEKYDIPEGKNLGKKLKMIEEEWIDNNFQLTEKQITDLINR